MYLWVWKKKVFLFVDLRVTHKVLSLWSKRNFIFLMDGQTSGHYCMCKNHDHLFGRDWWVNWDCFIVKIYVNSVTPLWRIWNFTTSQLTVVFACSTYRKKECIEKKRPLLLHWSVFTHFLAINDGCKENIMSPFLRKLWREGIIIITKELDSCCQKKEMSGKSANM